MSAIATITIQCPDPAQISISHFPADEDCREFWSVQISIDCHNVNLIIHERQQADLWAKRAAVVLPAIVEPPVQEDNQ